MLLPLNGISVTYLDMKQTLTRVFLQCKAAPGLPDVTLTTGSLANTPNSWQALGVATEWLGIYWERCAEMFGLYEWSIHQLFLWFGFISLHRLAYLLLADDLRPEPRGGDESLDESRQLWTSNKHHMAFNLPRNRTKCQNIMIINVSAGDFACTFPT